MDQIPWTLIQERLKKPNQIEDAKLTKWLSQNEENKVFFNDLKVIYSMTGSMPDSFTPPKNTAWLKIRKRINVKTRLNRKTRVLLRIAASFLLIALGIGGAGLFQKFQADGSYTEVFSPYGHKTLIILPDSTKVWLNGNTHLRYCSNFNHHRDVELEGEALFEVSKDPRNLFVAKAGDLKVEVYGTTFNLKSYNDDIVSEVALVEGSIGLFKNKQLLKKMESGEVVRYDSKENRFNTYHDDLQMITSWSRDELIIENETFENVIKYLTRWYGVEITVDESLTLDQRLSFSVKTESLTELMSVINLLVPISYKVDGKNVKISNK